MRRKIPRERTVDLRDIKVNNEFAPKPDPVFNHLLLEAAQGRIPAYFAVVEFRKLKRFDVTHRPELTLSGKQIVAQIIAAWPDGTPWPLWVYPSGGAFIASDDYFTFAACEQERLDYVPCLVLGTPEGEGVAEVQGPLTAEQIKRRLGFAR